MKKTVLGLMVVGLLAGCSTEQAKTNTAQDNTVRQAAKAAEPAPAPAPAVAVDPLNDPNNILSQRSVYFDFDKSIVHDEYMPMLKAHAGYLTSHSSAHIQIQGNTDERGSAEYNLGLGQRRADSVAKSLELMNVASSQISTVSFGKSKPRAVGHNETAWAQNRRADIVYQSE